MSREYRMLFLQKTLAIILCCAFSLGPSLAIADDADRTLRRAEKLSPDTKLCDYSDFGGSHVQWTAPIGFRSGPMILASGYLFVGTTDDLGEGGGRLICFDAHSGKRLWQITHPYLSLKGHDHARAGIRSRPCVDEDRVYYVSNRGELTCLDTKGFYDDENDGPYRGEINEQRESADIVWKLDMVTDLNVLKMDGYGDGNPISSPLVVGDLVYCVTGNGCNFLIGGQFGTEFVPRPEAPSFIAVNKHSGKVVWSSSLPGKDLVFSWSSPVLAHVGGKPIVIFPGGDGRLYGFDPKNGRLHWKIDCNEPDSTRWTRAKRGTRKFFVATPTVQGEMLYVGLNHDGEGWPESAPLHGIDLHQAATSSDKAIKWRFNNDEFEGTYSSAVVKDDVVFSYSELGRSLFAIDRENGKELWRTFISDDPVRQFGSPTIHNGMLYLPGLSSIHVFKAARQKCLLGRYEFGTTLWGTPQISGNTIYLTLPPKVIAVRLCELDSKAQSD